VIRLRRLPAAAAAALVLAMTGAGPAWAATGSQGAVRVSIERPAGADGPLLTLDNQLPGEARSAAFTVRNDGTEPARLAIAGAVPGLPVVLQVGLDGMTPRLLRTDGDDFGTIAPAGARVLRIWATVPATAGNDVMGQAFAASIDVGLTGSDGASDEVALPVVGGEQISRPPVAQAPPSLPFTGSNVAWPVAAALGLLAAGLLLVRATGRRTS